MTDYVMVHGAWRGSWVWKRVRRRLTAEGHRVFTPTLTGLGERVHLLSRDIGLETHIADITDLLIWEELRDIVLVGHCYAGVVIRHVADLMPDRIRSLVYLNASVPEDGKTLLDYFPNSGNEIREKAAAYGDGWLIPPPAAVDLLDNPADAPWVDDQCTMQPLSTFEATARITGACDGVPVIGYILADGWRDQFQRFYDQAGERRWWRERFSCGHDVMLDMPEELSALLMSQA